jgi:hypothetical protein
MNGNAEAQVGPGWILFGLIHVLTIRYSINYLDLNYFLVPMYISYPFFLENIFKKGPL